MSPEKIMGLKSFADAEMDNSIHGHTFRIFSVVATIMSSLLPVLLTFPFAFRSFRAEVANGMYGASTFYFAKLLADFPLALVFPLVYTPIAYYLTAQPLELWRFASFTAILVLTALISESIALVVSALLARSPMAVSFVGPLTMVPLLLLSGVVVMKGHMPPAMTALQWASFTKFTFDGLAITMHGFGRCTNDVDELSSFRTVLESLVASVLDQVLRSLKSIEAATGVTAASSVNSDQMASWCLNAILGKFGTEEGIDKSGHARSAVMEMFQLRDDDLIICYIMLGASLLFLRLLAYILIVYRARQKS